MSIPSITNCPNCGAPIDISRSSCEYCGTPYEKSNDIHILVYSQVRQSIQATQQELLSGIASATAWKPTPEEERKMIEDMCNVAPTIFPKIEPTVEYIKYNTKLERLRDAVWFWFVVLIVTIGCSLLPFIIF